MYYSTCKIFRFFCCYKNMSWYKLVHQLIFLYQFEIIFSWHFISKEIISFFGKPKTFLMTNHIHKTQTFKTDLHLAHQKGLLIILLSVNYYLTVCLWWSDTCYSSLSVNKQWLSICCDAYVIWEASCHFISQPHGFGIVHTFSNYEW